MSLDAYARLGFARRKPSVTAIKQEVVALLSDLATSCSEPEFELKKSDIPLVPANAHLEVVLVTAMTGPTSPNKPARPSISKHAHARTTTLPRSPAVTCFQQPDDSDLDSVAHDSAQESSDTMHSDDAEPHSPPRNSDYLSARTAMLQSSPASSTADASPWIGGTGLGNAGLGKSGKVIERMMAECDRLKRELKSEIAKREELQRAAQTHKERLEQVREENSILSNAKATDENMIRRRDRKIDELKIELHIERQKRESLESRVVFAETRQQEQEQTSNERLQRYLEEAKQATTSAAIYQTSHRQLREEYQQRIASSHRTLRELHQQREEDLKEREDDLKKIVKIDVVNQQMAQELEKTRRAHNDLIAATERERQKISSQIDDMLEETAVYKENERRRELEHVQRMDELREVANHMKWVMANQKTADERMLHSPPPSPLIETGT